MYISSSFTGPVQMLIKVKNDERYIKFRSAIWVSSLSILTHADAGMETDGRKSTTLEKPAHLCPPSSPERTETNQTTKSLKLVARRRHTNAL